MSHVLQRQPRLSAESAESARRPPFIIRPHLAFPGRMGTKPWREASRPPAFFGVALATSPALRTGPLFPPRMFAGAAPAFFGGDFLPPLDLERAAADTFSDVATVVPPPPPAPKASSRWVLGGVLAGTWPGRSF